MAEPRPDDDELLHRVVATLQEENSESAVESIRLTHNPQCLVSLAQA
jgi:hypothetical protein